MKDIAEITVADFEAGLGTLTRLGPDHVDALVVVAEPSVKSLEVARRALATADEKGLGRRWLVVNRVRERADDLVERELGKASFVSLPDDPAVRAADAEGRASFDAAPAAPAVAAIRALAESMVETKSR